MDLQSLMSDLDKFRSKILQNMEVNSGDVSEIKARAAVIKAKTEVLSSDEADHLPSKSSRTRDWKDEEDEEPENQL